MPAARVFIVRNQLLIQGEGAFWEGSIQVYKLIAKLEQAQP